MLTEDVVYSSDSNTCMKRYYISISSNVLRFNIALCSIKFNYNQLFSFTLAFIRNSYMFTDLCSDNLSRV